MDILEKKPIEKMFPKQQLLDWGLPYSDPTILDEHGNVIAKGQILSDVITLTRSWVTEHELVFSDPEDNSKMWKTTYSKLKDICSEVKFEDQEPWYSLYMVRCIQVNEFEKMIKFYEEILD